MEKRNFILMIAQLVVLTVFCLAAIGSGTSDQFTKNVVQGTGQGLSCTAQGYTFIGYQSNADCPSACKKAGYSSYCTGDKTVSCYCK